MKSHEGDLGREISKVHGMVCELRAGFSRALLELNQIQQGDTELQSQLEDTRHGCNKRSLHLESLVLSLKDELEEVRCQFRQLCSAQDRQPPENPEGENNGVDNSNGQCDGAAVAPAPSSVDGGLLINCYLQGLRVWQTARQITGADALSCHVTHSSLRRGRRRGVVEMLLRSEREYVSSLNQLYDKYKPTTASAAEKHMEFVKHVDQMLQRHLLFRNTLEERLTTDERSCAAGEAFLNLTGQNNKSFSEAYIGYMSGLADILTTEFSTSSPHNNPQNSQEKENLRLVSLLFAPVSRIHAYLNIIQALLHSSGAGNADWCSLQESERVLLNLCTSCHMTLEKAGPWEEGAGHEQGLRSRCCAESPDCAPSAFTKYCARANADTANDTAGPVTEGTAHQRKFCRVGLSRTLPRPNGILRNAREYVCEPPPGGWTAQYMWDGRGCQSHAGPVCAPFTHHAIEPSRFLNPGQPVGGGGTHAAAIKSPNSANLAVRVCGSPGLDGRVYTSDPPPHRLDDGDTDCDLADASVFDFSSVTTCSPDETLERLRRADACDEEDEEEDSEIPVLLKPSYTHNTATVQTGGSLCMPWQIPRRVPIPSEVRIGGQGKTRNPKVPRIPTSAFRPIWDPKYLQGDVTPAKENSVTFSATNQIISQQHQQQEIDQSRTAYRVAGVQRAEAVWHDSEDSEGPCSTV